MHKYETIEKFYQKIKAQTVEISYIKKISNESLSFFYFSIYKKGISDTDEITHKYLTREETYGELLIKIADYEKKIEHMKRDNESLRDKFNQVKGEYPTESLKKKEGAKERSKVKSF